MNTLWNIIDAFNGWSFEIWMLTLKPDFNYSKTELWQKSVVCELKYLYYLLHSPFISNENESFKYNCNDFLTRINWFNMFLIFWCFLFSILSKYWRNVSISSGTLILTMKLFLGLFMFCLSRAPLFTPYSVYVFSFMILYSKHTPYTN